MDPSLAAAAAEATSAGTSAAAARWKKAVTITKLGIRATNAFKTPTVHEGRDNVSADISTAAAERWKKVSMITEQCRRSSKHKMTVKTVTPLLSRPKVHLDGIASSPLAGRPRGSIYESEPLPAGRRRVSCMPSVSAPLQEESGEVGAVIRRGGSSGEVGAVLRRVSDMPRASSPLSRQSVCSPLSQGLPQMLSSRLTQSNNSFHSSPAVTGREASHPDDPSYQQLPTDAPPISEEVVKEFLEADSVESEESEDETERKKEPLPQWRVDGQEFIHSLPFQGVMAGLILLNSVVLGAETDHPDLPIWNLIENVFLVVFLSETMLRLICFGPKEYFWWNGPDFKWNVFDLSIVALGLLDVLARLVRPNLRSKSDEGCVTIFRLVRLLRILRIFRIIRFLRKLYTLAVGFLHSVVAVSWVTLLMTFVIYVSSIVLARTMGAAAEDDEDYELLQNNFGTVPSAMLTLFEMMSEPDLLPYHNLFVRFPLFTLFTVAFVIFGSFGMIAMLTGVISESMFEKNLLRAEVENEERKDKCRTVIRECEELFAQIPNLVDGEATREALVDLLPSIRLLFERQNVLFAHDDLIGMIEVIDADGSGTISREEFRHFIVQMAEGLRPMLIMELYYAIMIVKQMVESTDSHVQELRESFENSAHTMPGRFEDLGAQLQDLGTSFQATSAAAEINQSSARATAATSARAVDSIESFRASAAEVAAETREAFAGLSRELQASRERMDSFLRESHRLAAADGQASASAPAFVSSTRGADEDSSGAVCAVSAPPPVQSRGVQGGSRDLPEPKLRSGAGPLPCWGKLPAAAAEAELLLKPEPAEDPAEKVRTSSAEPRRSLGA